MISYLLDSQGAFVNVWTQSPCSTIIFHLQIFLIYKRSLCIKSPLGVKRLSGVF